MSSTLALEALDGAEILGQITDQIELQHLLTRWNIFLPTMTTSSVSATHTDKQSNAAEKLRQC